MNVHFSPPPNAETQDLGGLKAEIERVRASDILGRSGAIRRLFDFLSERSLSGQSPKEAEVAMEVFGRGADFPAGDATVRVYVHRLRRKLEAKHPNLAQPIRLTIPLGEYRLSMLSASDSPTATGAADPATPSRRRLFGMLAASAAAGAAVAGAADWGVRTAGIGDDAASAGRNRLWAPLLQSARSSLLVLGDYYIFGEETEDGSSRLVREYNVNSPTDLNAYLMEHSDRMATYTDLGLSYLPSGTGRALISLAPILRRARSDVRVVMSSKLTPQMIKENNIVYLGYLSGLSLLKELAFAGSRFVIGETYDELMDSRSRRRYFSQGGGPQAKGALYRDYGYLSTFVGPSANRFLVIAGTRDAGLMQMAQIAAAPASLKQLKPIAAESRAFEALYSIDGMDQLDLDGRLVLAEPLDESKIWNMGGEPQNFPAG